MLVETYEVKEISANGAPECDAEALALIESLGLDGQKSLIATAADSKQNPRF